MRTDIHPKGCPTHDGLRTVRGCAVCRAEKIEAAARALMVSWDKGWAIGRERDALRSALSEEEGTPALTGRVVGGEKGLRGTTVIHVEVDARPTVQMGAPVTMTLGLRALSPSPATPSEPLDSACPVCSSPEKWAGMPHAPFCGSGRATPRGQG